MDRRHQRCGRVVVNGDCPVWCSEETLLPLLADVSLQIAMDSHRPPASHSAPPTLPELRLVLLGRKGAGKSSAGNTILEDAGGFESGKPTEECVRKQSVVSRRTLVVVVDTPGWEWYYPHNSTPNWVRRENLRGMSLCLPGPHAVLLVVRACASVTHDYLSEIEEHLDPLGEGVWGHTMLLFTRGDELGLTSIEQRLLTSGPALQKLLQKCGGRYHLVDNRSRGDGTQVRELLRKLEEMLDRKEHGCGYLAMDDTSLSGLEEDGVRRARERRKRQRQMEEQIQRMTIRAALMSDGPQGSELDAHHSFSKSPRRLPEIRLVLLGERETGKSSAGNAILGQPGVFQVGAVTEECVCREAEVASRLVTLVDTPGWEGGVSGPTPERVKREIVSSVSLCPPGPHALLVTLRVDALVAVGHVREHLELLGEGVWRHTILLFTHGDQLREGVDIERHLQGGGRDLQWLLEKCRGRFHVVSSSDGGGGGSCKVTELLQEVEKMAAMNRCEAFSGLVQEIQDLSRERNEKFNLQMKEMGDKMIRQKTELRKMREREMRSIRWFFERRKKVKSPEKVDVKKEEDEDEDGGRGKRKDGIGDLEERMRFLTEDKEREIQDLIIEKERIFLALNQSRREEETVTFRLEVKEREIEGLKERVEEQELKLLDLERSNLENQHVRKQREEDVRMKEEERVSEKKKLKEEIEQQKKEKEEWMERYESVKGEMDGIKRQFEDILILKREEGVKNREMEERFKAEMKIKLFEKEEEIEDLKKKASKDENMEETVREMESQHKKEMERKTHQKEMEIRDMERQHQEEMTGKITEIENMMDEMKIKHQEEMEQKTKENAEDRENIQKQHDSERMNIQRQIEELKRHFAKETEEQIKAGKNLNRDMEQKMNEKEKELQGLKHLHHEEMAKKVEAMEKLKEEIQTELMKEKAKDVEKVQQELIDKIRTIEQEREREAKEIKQKFAEENEKQLKERDKIIRDLEQNYATEIKERALKKERDKEMMNKAHEKYILQKAQETDKIIEEIKRQHISEIEEKMQEHDKEKDRIHTNLEREAEKRLEEKDEEIDRMKLSVKEMKEKMENREFSHLNDYKNIEKMLEEREREAQEIKERLRETEGREKDHLNRNKKLEEKLQEEERVIEKLNQHVNDINEILQRIEGEKGEITLNQRREAEKQMRNREREMEKNLQLLNDMERRLKEKESENESLKQQLNSSEKKRSEEERMRKERDEMETNKLKEIIDEKTREITETKGFLSESNKACANLLEEILGLKERSINQTLSIIEINECHMEQERKKDAEIVERLQKKDEELHRMRQKETENEKEVLQLRSVIEQTKTELKELTARMDKEMTSMIEEYEKEIVGRDRRTESIANEKERVFRCLEEESRQRVLKVTEKYEESQRRVDSLQEENEDMRKEVGKIRVKYEDLEKKSQEEVRRHLEGYEQQVKSIEAELQGILKERDVEVRLLKEENVKLKEEVERMMEMRETQSNDQEKEFSVDQKQDVIDLENQQKQRDVGSKLDEKVREQRVEIEGDREIEISLESEKKWEVNLKEREEELFRREKRSVENGQDEVDDDPSVHERRSSVLRSGVHVWQDLEEQSKEEKEEEGESDGGGRVKDDSNNHKAVEATEKKTKEKAEVSQRKNAESAGSDLRVMVFGESWSSRSPAGASVLGGGSPEYDLFGFRHWKGQIEGRSFTAVEPLGLRWRDGPHGTDAAQRKSILDCISWFHPPGPDVVLLVIPAFLNCTREYRRAAEEHMGLLGDDVWGRTLVLLTWGEVLGESAEQHVLRNGELTRLVEQCGGRFHMITSKKNDSMMEGLFRKMGHMVAVSSVGPR
ncbi:trichohyalin [Antennarius striatus]|uniref:trichohyalin n=1 Tax=Antennarius striatus TaxID=241820 RepID=UPI0035B46500